MKEHHSGKRKGRIRMAGLCSGAAPGLVRIYRPHLPVISLTEASAQCMGSVVIGKSANTPLHRLQKHVADCRLGVVRAIVLPLLMILVACTRAANTTNAPVIHGLAAM